MPPSPSMRTSPSRERTKETHKRGRSLEHSLSLPQSRDDDLELFATMQDREKERESFLLQSSDDFDESLNKLRYFSEMKPVNIPSRGETSNLLNNEGDKNDYDWLLTPPDTPLFPSLDDEQEEPPQLKLITRGRTQTQSQSKSLSRSSTIERMTQRSSRSSASPSRHSPSPRSSISSATPSASRRISTPPTRQPATRRSASPTPRRISTPPPSTKRGVSPSTKRGVSPSKTLSSPRPQVNPRRQSMSPTPSRSASSSQSHDDDVDSMNSVHFSARKNLGGIKNRTVAVSKKPVKNNVSSTAHVVGSTPKRSFDSALWLMDHRKAPQIMFRPLLSSVPTHSFISGKSNNNHNNVLNNRAVVSRNSSLTTSSNASSDHVDYFGSDKIEGSEEVFMIESENLDEEEEREKEILLEGSGNKMVEVTCSRCKKRFLVLEMDGDVDLCEDCVEILNNERVRLVILSSSAEKEVIDEENKDEFMVFENEEKLIDSIDPNEIMVSEIEDVSKGIFDKLEEPNNKCLLEKPEEPSMSNNNYKGIFGKREEPSTPNKGIFENTEEPSTYNKGIFEKPEGPSTPNKGISEEGEEPSTRNHKGIFEKPEEPSTINKGNFEKQVEPTTYNNTGIFEKPEKPSTHNNKGIFEKPEEPRTHNKGGIFEKLEESSTHHNKDIFDKTEESSTHTKGIFDTKPEIETPTQILPDSNSEKSPEPMGISVLLQKSPSNKYPVIESKPSFPPTNVHVSEPYYTRDHTSISKRSHGHSSTSSSLDLGPFKRTNNSDAKLIRISSRKTKTTASHKSSGSFSDMSVSFGPRSENNNHSFDAEDLTEDLLEASLEENLVLERENLEREELTDEIEIEIQTETSSPMEFRANKNDDDDDDDEDDDNNNNNSHEELKGLKKSFTLEEATDTILFCSSIIHDLAYKAASIAIEKDESTPEEMPAQPTVTIIENAPPRTPVKRIVNARKVKRKRPEGENNSVDKSGDLKKDEGDLVILSGENIGNTIDNKDSQKPPPTPKLEAKCNCIIM